MPSSSSSSTPRAPRRLVAGVSVAGLTLAAVIVGHAVNFPASGRDVPAAAGAGVVAAPGASFDPAPGDRYFSDGVRVDLGLSPSWIALKESPGLGPEDLFPIASEEPILGGPESWERLPIDVTLARLAPGARRADVLAAIERLRRDAALAWAAPVYFHRGERQVFTDALFVGFEPSAAAEARAAAHAAAGAGEVAPLLGFENAFRVRLRRDDPRSVLDLVALYDGAPGVAFAEPEFYFEAGLAAPNDPLFPSQWALRNTGGYGGGEPGADLGVEAAWDVTTGDPSIVVAIVDEGVDMDHEDLAANVIAGFDTTDQSSSPPGGIPGNAACNDGHGTACAGIAAAVAGNALGVSGVAPSCRLVSVRIGRGNVWTKNDWAANGINAAWQAGADVISNSWGGGSASTLVTSAVNAARANGRGGLGSLVFFAAGNGNETSVDYPANLSNSIAVGATSPCDERKSPSSCDGETWWGSNRGSALDLVAPGVLVYTTDVASSCAYSGGSYFGTFNGTSAATPHVAGAAALVLSVAPSLTATQVQTVLQDTARDLVGNPAEDVPGRDDAMGHGRVDVLAAVLAAAGIEDAPVVSSISPASGPQRGGTEVTVLGENFFGTPEVRFGGASALAVARIDSTRLVCVAPALPVLGAVDVEVATALGTGGAAGAFTSTENPVRLTVSGAFDQGALLTLGVEGGPGRKWGLAVSDLGGESVVRGYPLCFSTSGSILRVLHRPTGSPLGAAGTGIATYSIPADFPTLGTLYFQGLVENAAGSFVVTNCEAITVF